MNKSILSALLLFIFQTSFSQTKKITGFFEPNIQKQQKLETNFDGNLDKENIGRNIKLLSAEPHHLSSARNKENADYILNQFKKYGWEAKLETFYVLFHLQNLWLY